MFRSLLITLALVASACGGAAYADGADETTATSVAAIPAATEAAESRNGADTEQAPAETPPASTVGALSPLAAQVQELPPASGIPEIQQTAAPISMSFDAIGVEQAPIDKVGVLDNGEMEIPGARNVGWYQYGSSPGEAGSAVLAAHIAFDGERGVFRFLADSQVGDRFTVAFDDGTEKTFEIFERAQYGKLELPFDRVFARDGRAVVTLISCGGTFQRALSSYEDNIVAYAAAID
jgi:hypothetical protein